jgi:molecular chaperone DnaK
VQLQATCDVADEASDTEALEKAFYAISEKLYKEAQAQGGNQGAGPEQGADGNFYGADYEDKTGN